MPTPVQSPLALSRPVAGIYSAPATHWVGDGFRVRGYFHGTRDLALELSPFVLLDYAEPFTYEANDGFPRGVGPHPHRGFETVTIAFAGSLAHHDSTGQGGIIGPGDVQWMTAGAGILHQEYHSDAFSKAGGVMHMAQIWVNLPAAQKMTPPGYQHITADRIAVAELPDNGGTVRVIAGRYGDVRGPAKTMTPIDMYEVRLNADGVVSLDMPAHHHTSILVMAGDIMVNGEQAAKRNEFMTFGHTGAGIRVRATSDAHLLVLSGEPIEEPIARYGPFVMNTEEEIRTAIRDYKNGKFGTM